jgi:hypothetical protein
MHGIAARLPQRAGVRDYVGFIVDATGYIVFDARELTGRSGLTLLSTLTPFALLAAQAGQSFFAARSNLASLTRITFLAALAFIAPLAAWSG